MQTPVQKANPNLKRKTKKQQIKLFRNQFIYVEVAKKILPEDPQVYNDFSIGCDKYPLWYHFSCAGIPKGVNSIITGQWFCKVCKDL